MTELSGPELSGRTTETQASGFGVEPSSPDSAAKKRIDELFRPDSIWQSLGIFGYPADPEELLSDLEKMIASARLSERVPEDVQRQFDGVRKQYLHGVAEYDFFHIAAGRAYLIAESALRHRFLEYYDRQIPFVSRDGLRSEVLNIGNFEMLWHSLRDKEWRKEWRLQSKGPAGPHKQFNGSFASLIQWAFDEQVTHGPSVVVQAQEHRDEPHRHHESARPEYRQAASSSYPLSDPLVTASSTTQAGVGTCSWRLPSVAGR